MSKLMFAIVIGIAMTATASAHLWNRSAGLGAHGPITLRVSPCPVSYAFQGGFCVRAPQSKKAWFKRAIEDIL